MGWTSYNATFYKPDGSVDRKAEMDNQFTQQGTETSAEWTVLKSKMVGSTYYAAVHIKGKETDKVVGIVALTSTKWYDGWSNFGYKDMDETMGPYCYDCPKAILDLLSTTDNEFALNWRKKCRENAKLKVQRTKLNKLPLGTKIKFVYGENETVLLKHSPAYQFKKPFWMVVGENHYFAKKRIPLNYEIVKEEG